MSHCFYRRGLLEADADVARPVSLIASTGDEDRQGDVIEPGGWQLDRYRANPVVLFAHDRSAPPVARAQNVRVEGGRLRAEVQFAPTDSGAELEKLVRGGFMNGVSVGFRPLPDRVEILDSGGLHFLEQELLEISLVPVPANAEAVVSSREVREALIKMLGEKGQHMDPVAVKEDKTAPALTLADVEAVVQRAMARPVGDPAAEIVADAAGKAPAVHTSIWSRPRKKAPLEPGKDKGLGLACVALAQQTARENPGMSIEEAAKALGFDDVADAIDAERSYRKALGVSTVNAGAAFVPETFAATFIDELAPATAVRALIPPEGVVQLSRGEQFTIPEVTSRPTSYFLNEASAPANSTPATGLRTIDLKWMATEVIVGKDWLSGAIANGEQIVRALMVRSASLREDLALLEGLGTENEPRGIKLWAGNSTAATGGTPALADVMSDLLKLDGYLEDNNVPMDANVGYLGHPIMFRGLKGMADAMGGYPLRIEMARDRLLNGHKFAASSQFNKTGANACFYVGNFAEAMLIDGLAMEIEADTTYVSSGTTHSASAKRQTVFRLWRRFGFGVKHANAFAYLSTCTWGA